MRWLPQNPSLRRPLGPKGTLLLIVVLAGPAAVLLAGRSVPALDPIFESPRFHLLVVSGIAACALLLALAAVVAAARDGRGGTVLLAIGCVSRRDADAGSRADDAGHARPAGQHVGRSARRPRTHQLRVLARSDVGGRSASRLVAQAPTLSLATAVTVLLVGSAVIVIDPTVLSGTAPLPGEDLVRTAVLGFSLALFVIGAIHWRRWRLGRDRVELSLVLASWLAMSAILSFGFGMLWRLSWWDYHVYLFTGFSATAWAVSRSTVVRGACRSGQRDLGPRSPRADRPRASGGARHLDRRRRGQGSDTPMVTRCGSPSCRRGSGCALDLEPEALRALHQGAFLHDVGKISVPDHVLNKPGDLTDEEWEAIKTHPVVGWDLAQRARSLRDSLAAIRHHHERWDGTGYPDRLEGGDIPLAGRIVGVADVWDALTSDRAYRPAWPLDQAIVAHRRRRRDAVRSRCVEAFLDVLGESGLAGSPSADVETLFRESLERHRPPVASGS